MKGKKKLLLPLLLAGVTATAGYVAPVQQAVSVAAKDTAETAVIGSVIKVEDGFLDNYKVGDAIPLPSVTGAEVDFTVTKGKNKVKVLESDGTVAHPSGEGTIADGDKYFIASYEGYYNISIATKAENQVKTEVKNLTVWVEKSDASIVLPTNSQYVIPAKMPVNQTGFKIPAPSVIIGDEEDETTIAELEANEQIAVLLYSPKSSTPIVLNSSLDATKSYYDVASTNLDTAGTYTIVYQFRTGADSDDDGLLDTVITSLDSNFQVVSKYDLTKVKLTMTPLDSVPTSGNVNTEIKIPKIKVTESPSSLDAINSYVQVKITNLTTKTVLEASAFDYENFSFTPSEVGDYIITYKASIDLFGLTTSEWTPGTVIKVADKQSPKVRPTVDYVISDTDPNKITHVNGKAVEEGDNVDELLVSARASIPSAAKLVVGEDSKKSVKIKVPAIYGTDNLDTLSELTFERSYRAPNGAVTTITGVDHNVAAEVTLSTVGTYEFRYKVTDKAGNPAGYAEYDVVVYDSDEDMTKGETKLELNVPYQTISDKDEYLTFSVPTATDTYDKSIEVKTYYKINGEGDPIEITEKNTDGKYSIDIRKLLDDNKTTGVTSLTIYSEALIDGSLLDTREAFADGTATVRGDSIVVTSDEKVITIVDSLADQDAPEIGVVSITENEGETVEASSTWNAELLALNSDIVVGGATTKGISSTGFATTDTAGSMDNVVKINDVNQAAFNQGSDTLTLPAVKFTDTKDDNLAITVTITDSFGNKVSKVTTETITKKSGESHEYTVSGISFKLSNFGIYRVTYQAKDIGGNITVQTFGIRVNDKTAPTIVIEDENRYEEQIQVGQKFEVPTAKLVKNGETIKGTITWDIYQVSNGATYTRVGETGFVPLSDGTFSIIYYAEDEFGNQATLENSLFTVTAKDTKGPDIELQSSFISALNWNPDENESYQTITIPAAIANDGKFGGIDYGYGKSVDVVYTVTGPNSSTPTVSDVYLDGEGDYVDMSVKTFKASAQGIYTIKYTATDDAGNTTTITKTLSLGDCEKPVLEWKNEATDLPKEVALNSEFKLDLSKIVLTDESTTEEELFDKLAITLTDPSGNTVTNKGTDGVNCVWDMNSTGNYTLKFVVKDKVGNANTYSYQINVPAEEPEEEKISPVVGTILVVTAVVVLAGVVVYFVVSSKKSGKASTKKTAKKAKKD